MYQVLLEHGYDCHNFDLKKGSDCDLAGDAVWDPILRDVAVGEYEACFARPDCVVPFRSYTIAPAAHLL